jgi:hypothetical protein
MKKITSILAVCFVAALLSFTVKPEVKPCFLSFNKASGLKMNPPERMPEENDHTRKLPTDRGELDITIADGYRILYLNKKHAPFVNLKVELSAPENYEADKRIVLDNLKYLNANSAGMESKDLLELSYNGYKIYGLSRAGIENGSTLGTFVMFPGDNTIVYFYFNNLKPGYRTFENVDEYKSLRNDFIGEYTAYIKQCK